LAKKVDWLIKLIGLLAELAGARRAGELVDSLISWIVNWRADLQTI